MIDSVIDRRSQHALPATAAQNLRVGPEGLEPSTYGLKVRRQFLSGLSVPIQPGIAAVVVVMCVGRRQNFIGRFIGRLDRLTCR
jgi:hypothetical protein